MFQLFGLGAPLVEFGARYIVWLYMPALLCFMVAISFLKDGVKTLIYRYDLEWQARLRLARYHATQGLIGLVVSPLVFLAIYFRKELFQCLAGLF